MRAGLMTQAVGCFPHKSVDDMSKEMAWHNFYYKLTYKRNDAERKEALEKVIQTVEKSIPALLENKFEQWDDSFSNEHVTKSKISEHFFNYLAHVWRRNFDCTAKNDTETKRIMWNYMNNILRCLKRIKNDEAPFMLPYEDKKLTLDFIERLNCPPPDYLADYLSMHSNTNF
jgi:hypothetical protein